MNEETLYGHPNWDRDSILNKRREVILEKLGPCLRMCLQVLLWTWTSKTPQVKNTEIVFKWQTLIVKYNVELKKNFYWFVFEVIYRPSLYLFCLRFTWEDYHIFENIRNLLQ